MILEWLHARMTPAPRHIRSLGLVHEAIAIEARFARCKKAWHRHLENSKEQVIQAIIKIEPGGEVIILGSGGLHDVPLAELCEHFRSVRLWDVVHTPRARAIAARYPGAICETVDITGLCEDFSLWLKGKRSGPPRPCPPSDLPTGTADLIVSLNLMSQLPLQMMAKARAAKYQVALDTFADDVIKSHLKWLKAQSCPVLLLSDLERHYRKGNVLEVETALPSDDMDLGPSVATWTWDIAPEGEAPTFDTIVHKVGAFTLN